MELLAHAWTQSGERRQLTRIEDLLSQYDPLATPISRALGRLQLELGGGGAALRVLLLRG